MSLCENGISGWGVVEVHSIKDWFSGSSLRVIKDSGSSLFVHQYLPVVLVFSMLS